MAHRSSNPRSVAPWMPFALVVLTVGQGVSSALSGLLAPESLRSGADVSPLVPPGPWFAVWGPIIVVSALWAIAAVRPSARRDPLHGSIARGLLVTAVGFSVWVSIAAFGQSAPLTVPVLAIMVLGLAWSARVAARHHDEIATWPRWERLLLALAIGLYLGWTSMALFLNIATVIQASGVSPEGAYGTVWQAGLLALAAGLAVVFVLLTRGSLVYAATVAYALVGVTISLVAIGFPPLWPLSLGVAVVAVASALVVRKARRGSWVSV